MKKRILTIILMIIICLSSSISCFAMSDGIGNGFTEDIPTIYDDSNYLQVYNGIVYNMYWGVPDTLAQTYGLDKVVRNQNFKYWIFVGTSSAGNLSSYPHYVIQFNYDGINVPTNLNPIDPDPNVSTSSQLRRLIYYFKDSYVYAYRGGKNSLYKYYDNLESNSASGLTGVYGFPLISNANLYFNDGSLIVGALPGPDNSDLGWEDAFIPPRDDVGDYFDEDGNLLDDDTDYGIFTPIVNFFKLIVNRLQAIYAFVKTINIAIINALRIVFTDPINSLKTAIQGWQYFFDNFDINMETLFSDMVTGIGDKITDSISGFFLPSDGYFEEKVNFLKNKVSVTFGIGAYDMSGIVSSEKSFTDIDINYKGAKATIVDFQYVINALATFRPIIRGLIVLWLVFYNINQFLGFIGQPAISLGNMIRSFAGDSKE